MQFLKENKSLSNKGYLRNSDTGGTVVHILLHSSSNVLATSVRTAFLREGSAITALATEGQSPVARSRATLWNFSGITFLTVSGDARDSTVICKFICPCVSCLKLIHHMIT